ncbi:hypothetical protein [Campylobacter sputorum]|uniref:hypothetical protein n=1 Tax=Campylobacter sputorum TaxID=206 RepID=UPI000ABD293A|nr:hypothetical protein [Campylobacter sputorum]
MAESDRGKHQDIADRRAVFSKIFSESIDETKEYKAFCFTYNTKHYNKIISSACH